MKQTELAKALGVSNSRITALKKQGMPLTSVAAAQEWRKANGRSYPGRDTQPGRVTAAPLPIHPIDADFNALEKRLGEMAAAEKRLADDGTPPPTYAESRNRREAAEARLAEIKLATEQAELVRWADVRAGFAVKLSGVRDALLQIPARLAPVMPGISDQGEAFELLEREIKAALAAIVKDMTP